MKPLHNEDADVPRSDNELIAEFMGGAFYGPDDLDYPNKWFFPIQPHEGYRKDAHHITSGLRYNIDWSWLMPVVEKIHGMGKMISINLYTDPMCCETLIYNWGLGDPQQRSGVENNSTIESVYKAVVEFIKWYNMQPKP